MLKTKPITQHVQDSSEGVFLAEISQAQCCLKPLAVLLQHINKAFVAIRHSYVRGGKQQNTPRPMDMADLLAGRYLKDVSRHSAPPGGAETRSRSGDNKAVREAVVAGKEAVRWSKQQNTPKPIEMSDLPIGPYLKDVSRHSSLIEEPEGRVLSGDNKVIQPTNEQMFSDQRARLFAQLGIRSEETSANVEDVERIIASLSHIEVKKRIDAAHTLADLYMKLPSKKQMHARINLILMTWRDVDMYARIAAIKALGRTEMPDVAEALQIALRDEEQDVRAAAARALGGIKSKTPLIALIAVFMRENEHWSVRAAAIRAMGASEERVFLNTVNLALDDEDDSVRIAAIQALAQLEGLQAAPRLALIAQHDRLPHVKHAAILELENLSMDA